MSDLHANGETRQDPLHITHLYYESARGGISSHVLALCRMLPQLRHTVVLPANLEGVSAALKELGAEPIEIPMRSRILPRSVFSALPLTLRRIAPDLVHIHSIEAAGFGHLATRLARVHRCICTPHSSTIRKRWAKVPFFAMVRALGRRDAAWIALSSGQVEELCQFAPRERIELIPNAAPTFGPLFSRQEACRQLGWPDDRPLIVCVGRLVACKDPHTLLRAATRNPNVRIVFVGEGPMAEELGAEASENVLFAGYVSPIELALAAADVVCLPSLWEGMPYSILEALACGKAVVATNIPGVLDLIRHEETGLIFNPGDDEAFANAIARLADDPALRQRLGDAGRRLVEDKFSEASVAKRLLDLYRRVTEDDQPQL